MKKTLKIFLAVLIVVLSLTAILAMTATAEEKTITVSFINDYHPFSTSTSLDKKVYADGKVTVKVGEKITMPTESNHANNGQEGYQLVWFTEDGRTYKAGESVSFTKDTKLFRNMFKEAYTQEDVLAGMTSGSHAVMLMTDIELTNSKIGVWSENYAVLNLNGYNLTSTINGKVMGG
jgi:hypothetical protein